MTTAAAQTLQNNLAAEGLTITLIGAALMVLPLPLIRLIPAVEFDSLDGYVVGAAAALAHLTASYVIWWMPQIVAGLVTAQTTTATRMLADTITYGVIDPFTTITLGGMVGVSLWFRPDPAGPNPGRARTAVILSAVITAVLYAAVWWTDIQDWARGVELTINLVLTVLSVLARADRTADRDAQRSGTSARDTRCCACIAEKVVPDMAFCPVCGVAARASSRTSRRLRGDCPPAPVAL